MKKVILTILFLFFVGIAYADASIQKVEIYPLSGGVSFNTVSLDTFSWVTAPSVEMIGRKEIMIINPSTTVDLYLTGVSGSTATGIIYPRESATFKAASNLHIYVSASSVTTFSVWEIR